jgi:hypothetical protein
VHWTAPLQSQNCGNGWTSTTDVSNSASISPPNINCHWPDRYGTHANQWGSGNSGNHLVVQGDGNIVLYDGNGSAVWATNTAGNSGAHLALQDDGNMVVYYGSTPLWSLYGG